MIVLAEFYARYGHTLPEAELRQAGENLLKFAEQTVQEYYAERYDQLGITITVRIEVGSTRSRITIGGLVGALVLYGSIRQSVDYLRHDTEALAPLIIPGISRSLGLPAQRPEYHARRFGLPGRLHNLFVQVERGEISADEATDRAMMLVQNQGGTDVTQEIRRFKQQFSLEFHNLAQPLSRRLGEQHSLRSGQQFASREPEKKTPSLPPRPEPVLASPPGLPLRRRRRRGVVATRDHETGDVRINGY